MSWFSIIIGCLILILQLLEHCRNRGDLIQVFKIVHGLDNLNFDYVFKLSNYSGTRGHSFKLTQAVFQA